MFSGFFFHLCVVTPVVGWILNARRFSKLQGLTLAIGFLAVIAAINLKITLDDKPTNFYRMLNVPRHAEAPAIKRAYRVRSTELHPDRNPSESAAEDFNRLRAAYDVLLDSAKRKTYDLFGEKAAMNPNEGISLLKMIETISFYIMWGILAFALTLGENIDSARTWIYSVGLIMLVVEINMRFAEYSVPSWILPTTTPNELIELMHELFPSYLNGCRAIGGYMLPSSKHDVTKVLFELIHLNEAIILALRDIQVNLQLRESRKAANASAQEAIKAIGTRRLKTNAQSVTSPRVETIDDPILQTLQPDVAAPRGIQIPNLVWFIALYIVVNYFIG